VKQDPLLTWRSLSCYDIKFVIPITFFRQSQIIHPFNSRFKPATESGAVPPIHARHHELTPYPHVRMRKPLGCALENLLEESNIINSSLVTTPQIPFRRNFYITIPKQISNKLYDQPFLNAFFHVDIPKCCLYYRNNSNVLGISVELVTKCYAITYTISITLKGNKLREMVSFIAEDRKHAFRWLDLSVNNRDRRRICTWSYYLGWCTHLRCVFCMTSHS